MKNIHKITNIYITNDEPIKAGDWVYCRTENRVLISNVSYSKLEARFKIILTTDQDLDGVQHIDDEFLEWFIKNPSCEEVKIEDYGNLYNFRYLILIPQEEPKQETLEEVAANLFYTVGNEGIASIDSFIKGAKYQEDMADKKYTEEDMIDAIIYGSSLTTSNVKLYAHNYINSLNKQD